MSEHQPLLQHTYLPSPPDPLILYIPLEKSRPPWDIY